MKLEIHIGEYIDAETGVSKPKEVMIITEEQFYVIEQFASTRKDADLNTIYKLNDVEFKVMPHISRTSWFKCATRGEVWYDPLVETPALCDSASCEWCSKSRAANDMLEQEIAKAIFNDNTLEQ